MVHVGVDGLDGVHLVALGQVLKNDGQLPVGQNLGGRHILFGVFGQDRGNGFGLHPKVLGHIPAVQLRKAQTGHLLNFTDSGPPSPRLLGFLQQGRDGAQVLVPAGQLFRQRGRQPPVGEGRHGARIPAQRAPQGLLAPGHPYPGHAAQLRHASGAVHAVVRRVVRRQHQPGPAGLTGLLHRLLPHRQVIPPQGQPQQG